MKAAEIGITNRNTMVVPCIVKAALYSAAVRKVLSAADSWMRNKRASVPPTRKKMKAAYPYMIPIFL